MAAEPNATQDEATLSAQQDAADAAAWGGGIDKEVTDANGVTRPQMLARETLPRGTDIAVVTWLGAKRKPTKAGRFQPRRAGDHIDVTVPRPDDDPDATEDDIRYADNNPDMPIFRQGQHYHFAKGKPTVVAARHLDFLKDHLAYEFRVEDAKP